MGDLLTTLLQSLSLWLGYDKLGMVWWHISDIRSDLKKGWDVICSDFCSLSASIVTAQDVTFSPLLSPPCQCVLCCGHAGYFFLAAPDASLQSIHDPSAQALQLTLHSVRLGSLLQWEPTSIFTWNHLMCFLLPALCQPHSPLCLSYPTPESDQSACTHCHLIYPVPTLHLRPQSSPFLPFYHTPSTQFYLFLIDILQTLKNMECFPYSTFIYLSCCATNIPPPQMPEMLQETLSSIWEFNRNWALPVWVFLNFKITMQPPSSTRQKQVTIGMQWERLRLAGYISRRKDVMWRDLVIDAIIK